MEVYKAISAIIKDMSEQGIGKNSKNKNQGWQFRGIDAVYNALAPLLAKYELMILPRIKNRTVCERQTKNGGVLFYVTVEADFDFVSAKDGSKHTVTTIGEAMDSGDKATNKAMSIALKYAAFQSFFIPTDVTTADPDKEAHEVLPEVSDDDKPWYADSDLTNHTDYILEQKSKGLNADQILNEMRKTFKVATKYKAIIEGLK